MINYRISYKLFHSLLIAILFLLPLISCGLIQGTQVLKSPVVSVLPSSATMVSSDSGSFLYYGVDFYYKIYPFAASDQNAKDTYYSDFLNIWTPNAFSPSTAAATAKYFRVLYLNSGLNAAPPSPTIRLNSTFPDWTLIIDCLFNTATTATGIIITPIKGGTGTVQGPFFRNVLRSLPNAYSTDTTVNKSFVFSDILPGTDQDVSIGAISYCVGIIAMTEAQIDVFGAVQYSQPVQVGLFDIPN